MPLPKPSNFNRPLPQYDQTDVSAILGALGNKGWTNIQVFFDTKLNVWRATGTNPNGMLRENRGSTKILAANGLK